VLIDTNKLIYFVIIEVSRTVCSLIKTAVVESTNNDPFCWTLNRISRKKCKTKSMRKWAVLAI